MRGFQNSVRNMNAVRSLVSDFNDTALSVIRNDSAQLCLKLLCAESLFKRDKLASLYSHFFLFAKNMSLETLQPRLGD